MEVYFQWAESVGSFVEYKFKLFCIEIEGKQVVVVCICFVEYCLIVVEVKSFNCCGNGRGVFDIKICQVSIIVIDVIEFEGLIQIEVFGRMGCKCLFVVVVDFGNFVKIVFICDFGIDYFWVVI